MKRRVQTALANMRKSRGLLKHFLEGLTPDQWLWQPAEGINHVAWQAGHLAVAQHALCLRRVRGESPDDARFLPESFAARYGKGSTPEAGAEANATVDELLVVLDAVHERVEAELAERTDRDLDRPVDPPHPMYETVLGGVEFAPQHELMHVGQVVLLRRLMGVKPQW